MFAARDQENIVHGHQQLAAAKPLNHTARSLQPKTPGNKYPKTPLKIALNDENAPGALGAKTGKGKGLENLTTAAKKASFDRDAFVTPIGPRTRAPLGAKTTNAKARGIQTPAGPGLEKQLEKTQPQASTRRPKKIIHPESVKIEVHGDNSPLADRDVEYAPPRPRELPYESEDFPVGCLNYEPLKKGNLMRGIQQNYNQKLDANGLSRADRKLEEGYAKSARDTDKAVLEAMKEEWTVGDVPETFPQARKASTILKKPTSSEVTNPPANPSSRVPATIDSRRAASALSAPISLESNRQQLTGKPKPATSLFSRGKPTKTSIPPSNVSSMRHTAAAAASRSTIGYTKGRTASGALHTSKKQSCVTRSVSNLSQASDVTITPARFAQTEEGLGGKRFEWLSAFEIDDEDVEPGLKGLLPQSRDFEEEEEEFVMKLSVTE